MNLARTQRALLAVQRREQQEHLHVRRPRNEADVREMVEAGLLNVTFGNGSHESQTVIDTVTEAGQRFLRTFPSTYRFCEARRSRRS
jgi:DNA-binding MarR family transcriptional regulator